MTDPNNDLNDLSELDEPEEINDDDATLADDLLDEIDGTETEDDAVEGFGLVEEDDEEEDDEEEEKEEESLEDDAEDVDYDRFDDIDEM